jgi:RNA polymerase sigma-70 factor (ECF subfamily)
MDQSVATEQFVRKLTENQNRLYGYIYSLLGDHSRTGDVLQETNLVLWRKISQYEPGRPFMPWAYAIARFQVLAHLRDQKRERLLVDAELVESLSDDAERWAEEIDAIREALRPCLELLTPGNRELIEQRYHRAKPVAELAESLNRTVSAVKVALLRVRRQLSECVQKRMATNV